MATTDATADAGVYRQACSVTDEYVVMKQVSAQGPDSQWFDFTTGFFSDTTRVEWELGTMHIVLPKPTADLLVSYGYARLMTSQERAEYPLSTKNETTNKGG